MSGSEAGAPCETPALPEIWCDFNGRMTQHGYSLSYQKTSDDLATLGLTLESAVGRRFTFNSGLDCVDAGALADILCDGVSVRDPHFKYLALLDADGFRWRRQQA